MHVKLAHSIRVCKWNDDWIYLGSNYQLMRKNESKINGNRISINNLLKHDSKDSRIEWLEWLEKQRLENNDSLFWWMTHIAGRTSNFYLLVLQIKSIIKLLNRNKDQNYKILIVSEDIFLLHALYLNLNNNWNISLDYRIISGCLMDVQFYMLKIIFSIFRQIHWFSTQYYFAYRTKPKTRIYPTGNVYLIHQCLDNNSFENDINNNITCRYFINLPDWLENKGYKVIRLPWYHNNISRKWFDRLRQSNCLIPEDWITFSDYISAFGCHIKSSFTLKYHIKYPDINVSPIIRRERLQQICSNAVRFWRYLPMLKKISREIEELITIDHFENIFFEHVPNYFTKQMFSNGYTIGYYHTIVSSDFLGYHFMPSEWNSSVRQDRIVTTGELASSILIKQGVPAEIISTGPALRQNYKFNKNKNDKRLLLVVLPSSENITVEMLDKLNNCQNWLHDILNETVSIKPHPFLKKERVMKLLNWDNLPEGWCWHKGEIAEALNESYCAIIMASGGITDVVLNGCIPINLSLELDFPWVYLDHLQNKYPLLKPVDSDDIINRLDEIYFANTQTYKNQINKLREELIRGLSPINNNNLETFIK